MFNQPSKEVKDGFDVEQASQHRLIKNTAYAFVKVISYNLFQFFKAVALPANHQSWQIHTLRRKLRQFLWFVANDFGRCDLSFVYIQ